MPIEKAFMHAIQNRDLPLIKKLIEDGADLATKGNDDLPIVASAARRDDQELGRFIFSSKPTNTNDRACYDEALTVAVLKNNYEDVELLLKSGKVSLTKKTYIYQKKDGKRNEETYLLTAIRHKNYSMLKLLFTYGAKNLLYIEGTCHYPEGELSLTPILLAIKEKEWKMVELIADNYAAAMKKHKDFKRALLEVVIQKQIRSAKFLLQAGVPPTETSPEGFTCLDMAIRANNIEMIALLFAYDAPVTFEVEAYKNTPLLIEDKTDLNWCIYQGWQLYLQDYYNKNFIPVCLIQGQRQSESTLFDCPNDLLDKIHAYANAAPSLKRIAKIRRDISGITKKVNSSPIKRIFSFFSCLTSCVEVEENIKFSHSKKPNR